MSRTKTLPAQQAAAFRALELVLHIQATGGITTRDLDRRSGLSMADTSWLLHWLRAQFFITTVGGAHIPGPVLEMAARADQHEPLMQQVLDGLRDQIGAALYLARYTDGEIDILQSSHSPTAPPVAVKAPFPETGHASAVGKALLADLDFTARMEHLARYTPVPLTDRTITNPRTLFDTLDRHGPHAAQFDVLEYSDLNVCAAYSLTLPGHDTTCIALALPTHQHHRLVRAAAALSEASTGLLLTRLLTTPTATTPNTPTSDPRLPHTAQASRAIALP
ncbi:IclR family transcriptional regulator C-terminal domain-containing protein [Streptomyces sp. TLI_146]|uniref:IclR family transcriptional regulator domain-containing protein n=1 Tax=Streptomyces sp. TLI_146 TaxID=1938858 RepID=UPI000C7096DA|nr:IclR family transcriptional regulator C-terminal domain-containing protein [Streptomyces sp. TLI_146]PKV90173.1 DNA-binding IclR family transcriptional regulator [Streptomyces sp. TLI_146]